MIKSLLSICASSLLLSAIVHAQDPGLPDSLVVGNLDGSPIMTPLNRVTSIPLWLKSDDSIAFVHFPIVTNDSVIVSRNGGRTYPPLSLWDDVSFLTPNGHDTIWTPPHNFPLIIVGDTLIPPGYLSQSILGFAWLTDPEDPQNYLYTNYQWWHIADYFATITDDPSVMGDTSRFFLGHNPANGDILCGLSGGVIAFIPQIQFGYLIIVDFISGDANGSGSVNGLDEIFLVNYVRGIGPAPNPLLRGDANGDCAITGSDITYLVNYFLGRGPAPAVGNCP